MFLGVFSPVSVPEFAHPFPGCLLLPFVVEPDLLGGDDFVTRIGRHDGVPDVEFANAESVIVEAVVDRLAQSENEVNKRSGDFF